LELIKVVPFGKAIVQILAPDGVGQPISLLRFYILHIVITPVTVLLLSFLHFYRIRQNKEVLPYL
jgi:quinol-cytochrome oxidoreductase complex cytochrome b subunit